MLADDHPDRIQIAFDDHRLVANAGLLLPVTLGRHLGLPQLVDRYLGLGDGPGPSQHRRLGDDAGGLCVGGRRLHRRRRRVARWRYGRRHRLRGQGAIHLGYLPVSVLKNALSGRFSASDDFFVARCPLSPSQLVFVPSMAISQQYLMPSFLVLGPGRLCTKLLLVLGSLLEMVLAGWLESAGVVGSANC